jgi:hypothetical protein
VIVTIASLAFGADEGARPGGGGDVQTAQQMIADGKQTDAIKFIDQQLVQRRSEIADNERFALLMLKGEALIQTNKASMAGNAFEQARRAAADGRDAAVARAYMLLVRASPSSKYAPKKPGSEPIDIVNPESRRAALEALRVDLLNAAKPKMARATQSKTLPPAMELLPALLDVASVELAATGSTQETQADVASLGEHSRELMHAQIDRVKRRVSGMADMAFSIEEGETRKLLSNEVKEMQPMIAELRKIEKLARDVRNRARELGIQGTAWEQIAIEAADAADAAERVLGAGAPSVRN